MQRINERSDHSLTAFLHEQTWFHRGAGRWSPRQRDGLSTLGTVSIPFAWFAPLHAAGEEKAGVGFRVHAPALCPTSCGALVPGRGPLCSIVPLGLHSTGGKWGEVRHQGRPLARWSEGRRRGVAAPLGFGSPSPSQETQQVCVGHHWGHECPAAVTYSKKYQPSGCTQERTVFEV